MLQLAQSLGLVDFQTVLEAQRFRINARSRKTAAMRDFAKTLPALEAEVGVPLSTLKTAASTATTAPAESKTVGETEW